MPAAHLWRHTLLSLLTLHALLPLAASASPDAYSEQLLGSMGGFRDRLADYGVSLNIQSDDELWNNLRGGTRQKTTYDGVGTVEIDVDMGQLLGLQGGQFHFSWLNIRGRSISEDQLGDYNPISGYEAYQSNRLFELWYQQSFMDGQMDVKVGQQALDSEFLITDYGSLYLNANFGWPVSPSINLYSGSPAWPMASVGARLRYRPTARTTLMLAAVDDNPSGHDFYNDDDPSNQSVHACGCNFHLGTGTLFIAELQQQINLRPQAVEDDFTRQGLPGTYKVGALYDTAHFPDQRFDTRGNALSAPDSTGNAKQHEGNWILYAIADQMIWRAGPHSPRTLGVFGRITGNPGDRNTVNLGMDAGINLSAPFAGRSEDVVGIGWGLAHTSSRAREADRDARSYSDGYYPVRGNEEHVEITYSAQITPWWSLQPDIQYIHNPGGGVLNEKTGHKLHDETIVGLHSSLSF